MKLTAKGHYGVKALLDLSLQPKYGPASVREIAKRQDISAAYLEKILMEIRRAGLVKSVRGSLGGYKLTREPKQITLGEILEAVGETITYFPHLTGEQSQVEDWVTDCLWRRLYQKLKEALYKITLADLYYDARSWQASLGEETNFIV